MTNALDVWLAHQNQNHQPDRVRTKWADDLLIVEFHDNGSEGEKKKGIVNVKNSSCIHKNKLMEISALIGAWK